MGRTHYNPAQPFSPEYTRHTSNCRCVGSPESLTYVSSSGFVHLPPFCNSNYLGFKFLEAVNSLAGIPL
ncbi:hypothetical protein EAH77_22875 [Ewingella americana]|uniref:Uncharacterized protein n=1 Tax=Ewingella americana TaxID=41202 RepID=A0A502G1T7_9GAMM|nr:hypothetical protein EAH77_22875 [Ewingella americana]